MDNSIKEQQLRLKKKQEERWKKKKRPSFTVLFWGSMLLFGIIYVQLMHFGLVYGGPWQPPYGSNVDIDISVTPYWHGAPLNFTVTVVTDNSTDTETLLEWNNQSDGTGTIIRVAFGNYPQSATDGYLVYSGNLETYTDLGSTLNYIGEAYYSAFQEYGAGSYSADHAEGIARGTGMLEIAANIETYAVLIGEWFLVLALFGLALWHYDPWLYLITAIGLAFLGFTWYSTYPIIGVVVILMGAFCIYKTVRYFVG
jgi:hypothetical protein